jgi:hypothetical protein
MNVDIEDLHIMLLRNCELHENWYKESFASYTSKNKIFTILSTCFFWFVSNSVWQISAKMYLVSISFMKIGTVKATNYLGVYINFCPQLHIYCPIGIKASIGDLHIILLRIRKFHENWDRVGHNSYGCTWNYFTHIPYNHMIFLK